MADKVFKALADPTRRKILRILNEGDKSAGEISDRFEVTAATMSHHFNVLKDAGLVQAKKNGTSVIYSLDTTVIQDVMSVLFEVFGQKTEVQE
ncbi:MAG: winged helix-turn-helix transcriptional regulator [Armatimonadetes bacterium]|nr:winged helix-turn-helix transcriptional regulator [Armatimonadota bacterium]